MNYFFICLSKIFFLPEAQLIRRGIAKNIILNIFLLHHDYNLLRVSSISNVHIYQETIQGSQFLEIHVSCLQINNSKNSLTQNLNNIHGVVYLMHWIYEVMVRGH